MIRYWYALASSADGTRLVAAVENGGQIYTSSPANVPGTTPGVAGYLEGSRNAAIELYYLGDGRFVPINVSGTIQAF